MAAAHVMRAQSLTFPTPSSSSSPASAQAVDAHPSRSMYGQQYNPFYAGYQMPSAAAFMPPPQSLVHHTYTTQSPVQSQYRLTQSFPHPQPSAGPHIEPSPRDSSFRPLPSPGQFASPSQSLNSIRRFTAGDNAQPRQSSNPRSQHGPYPGPIPASQPIMVQRKQDGINTIKFEYSKERVKVMHEIQCNVDSIDIDQLTNEFKDLNCVYPRAHGKGDYKGSRLNYETECNRTGWALAALNPQLQGKRGLIQRAVDSWRNCANDPKLRSRRVRRLQKTSKRQQQQQPVQSQPGAILSPPSEVKTELEPVSHDIPARQNPYADDARRMSHSVHVNAAMATPGSIEDVSGT